MVNGSNNLAANSGASKGTNLGGAAYRPTSVFGYAAFIDGWPVSIPPSKVRPTQASLDYMSRKLEAPPSVCDAVNHLECNCATKLHMTDDQYLLYLKGQVGRNSCCAYCDDLFSRIVLEESPQLQCVGPFEFDGCTVPIERLSLTAAIPMWFGNSSVTSSLICRDHIAGHCKRMKDCQLFHICRTRPIGSNPPPSAQPQSIATVKTQQATPSSATSLVQQWVNSQVTPSVNSPSPLSQSTPTTQQASFKVQGPMYIPLGDHHYSSMPELVAVVDERPTDYY